MNKKAIFLSISFLVALFAIAACGDSTSDTDGCIDGDQTYALGDTWACSDGCNDCSCGDNGSIASTDLDCSSADPCDDLDCSPSIRVWSRRC